MNPGSDADPDQSSTCVMDIAGFDVGKAPVWRLSGPGIPETLNLQVDGMPAGFASEWRINHAAFPRGVDVFLANGQTLVGLPRTIRIVEDGTRGE